MAWVRIRMTPLRRFFQPVFEVFLHYRESAMMLLCDVSGWMARVFATLVFTAFVRTACASDGLRA